MSTLEQEIEFPKLDYDLIIAMRGLPWMGKSEIANAIGRWAGSPVLYIDDFLYTLSKEKGYTCESPPPNEEAARLHEVAFDGLCEAASHPQRRHNRCVVIKSRLDTTYELDRLEKLGLEGSFIKVLIIECQTKNEYRWQRRFDKKPAEHKYRHWYKPKIWTDVRKYRDDIVGRDPLHLPSHFGRFVKGARYYHLIQLCPFNDLILDPTNEHTFLLTSSFLHAIKGLLSRDEFRVRSCFSGKTFHMLRVLLLGQHLSNDVLWKGGGRSKHLCGKGVKRCQILSLRQPSVGKCGACEEEIDSGERGVYCCIFCPLSLHESCAKIQGFQSRGFEKLDSVKKHPYWADDPQQACDSCIEGKKSFSRECYSCLYQNYLKQQVFPTLVKHDSHTCPAKLLSIKFEKNDVCKACNYLIPLCSYGCYYCSVSYHMECLLLPQRLEHEHGGYQHVMELKYSRDEMWEEEGYWCDVCYQDIDPQNWFYSCKECHYEAHPLCTSPFSKYKEEFASKLRETASSSTS